MLLTTCDSKTVGEQPNEDQVTIAIDDSKRAFPVRSSNAIFKKTTSEPRTITLNGTTKRIGLGISACRCKNAFVVPENGLVYAASHYVNYVMPGGIAERAGFVLGDIVLQINGESVKDDFKLDKLLNGNYNLEVKVISVVRDKRSDKEFGRISKTDRSLPLFEKERLIKIQKTAEDLSFGLSLQKSIEKFGRKGQFKTALKIAQILKGGPADRAGLKAGDLVEEVNEVNAASSELKAMVTTLKEVGDSVNILVIRRVSLSILLLAFALFLVLLSIAPLVAINYLPPILFFTLLFVYILSFGTWAFKSFDCMSLGKRFVRALKSAIVRCQRPCGMFLAGFFLTILVGFALLIFGTMIFAIVCEVIRYVKSQ